MEKELREKWAYKPRPKVEEVFEYVKYLEELVKDLREQNFNLSNENLTLRETIKIVNGEKIDWRNEWTIDRE